MIERTSSIRDSIVDTYIHCFAALFLTTIVFLLTFRNSVTEVIDKYENVMNNIDIKSNFNKPINYDENLNDLDETYLDKSYFPSDITRNLKTSLYTQLGIFFISCIVVGYIVDKPLKYWRTFALNKLLFFAALTCLYIIFHETVELKYTDIFNEDIYKILQKTINSL